MFQYININIIDIISSVVSRMRENSNITLITDNHDGTYTVTLDSIGIMRDGWVITIENTPNFNGEHVAKSVNTTNKTFKIEKTTGSTISTYGTITSTNPLFLAEKWIGAKNEILDLAYNYVQASKMYPACLLLLDIESSFESGFVLYPQITLYFFIETNHVKNNEWRNVNTMSELRELYKTFMMKFRQSVNMESEFTHEVTEIFYMSYENKNQNKLGAQLDAIEIKFNNLKLFNVIG